MYIPNGFAILAGVTGVLALAMHGALWLDLRGRKTAALAHRIWWVLAAATCALAAATLTSQPKLVEAFAAVPWGYAFPVIGLSGLLGVFLCQAPETAAMAFLSSWSFLTGIAATAVFGAYSRYLPAGGRSDGSLTLAWWMPVTLVAATYAAFTYNRLVEKPRLDQ